MKTWFQRLLFKFNLYRYTEEEVKCGHDADASYDEVESDGCAFNPEQPDVPLTGSENTC